ncbi:unnamed protein product [Calypogeia fissa]
MATPQPQGQLQEQDTEPLTKGEIVELRAQLSPELHEEEWYTILTVCTASAHAGPEALPMIYEIASSEKVNTLSGKEADEMAVRIQRRMKESLLKGSVLFGIPAALDAVFALLPHTRAEAEQHPARDDSGFFLRRGQTLEGVTSRGMEQLRKVYRHNLDQFKNEMMREDMQDLRMLTVEVHYGWNLSECTVLDFKSTEMVILAALIPQNARAETLWHLRGCRRAGWSDESIRSVRDVCLQLANRLGCRTSKIPTLEDVREDTNE